MDQVFNLYLALICSVLIPNYVFTERKQDFSIIQSQSNYDPRVVTCQDLSREVSTRIFSFEGLEDFSQIVIDAQRQQLIIGARNHILRLHLLDLSQLELIRYSPDNVTVSNCVAKGQSKADCHNYIRVLLVHKNQVFACGTNAFAPQCSWRQVDRLERVLQWVSGVAKCPFNPHQNSTFIMTSDDSFYGATVTDFAARDPAIYRMMGSSKNLRTVQYNSRWLNEPDFVSAYEISEFVYFFFRETAVEYINCGKNIYSRVARVCKSDNGGDFLLEDNWTTFTKARLNCSLPGLYPFYFSELQDTYYDPDQQLVYATFTTSPTSIYGSAICIYNMTAFDQAFSGPFKYQAHPEMAWTRVQNESPHLQQCGVGVSGQRSLTVETDMTPVQRLLVDAQKFQMMDVAVQPTTLAPFAVVENERFNKIVVDRVRVLSHSVDTTVSVVFVATLEGVIHKMVSVPRKQTKRSMAAKLEDKATDDRWDLDEESTGDGENVADLLRRQSSCLVERIALPCEGSQSPILSLKLDRQQKILYIGTKDKVYRIAVQRCSRFATKIQCVSSQDPYCNWNEAIGRCLPTGNKNLTSCPILSIPVDGVWCHWSPWEPCQQTEGQSADNGQCLCRMRPCDCPRPAFGGRSCYGKSVEVANCTVHGNWTEWSSWSGCSLTCGSGLHTRQRTCSNPQPRFGGRICDGESIQTAKCSMDNCSTDHQYPAIDGQWSVWTEWSSCSVRCGGGHSIRSRSCNKPHPQNGGRGCVGNDRDWKQCNQGQCDEVRKLGDWSPWLRMNSSRDGYITERFRCVCKASVSDQMQLRPPQVKASSRFCSASGDDCEAVQLDIPDIDGGWSAWSAWTECDSMCGSGVQYRERQCSSPSPNGNGRECTGHARELTACNVHSCQGQWSCWSDYGPCSVTCGQGRKWRKRQCESELPGDYYTLPCKGGDLQEMTCVMQSCDGIGDYTEWTAWSSCNNNGVQQRRRNCTTTIHCPGSDVESRLCDRSADMDAASVERVKSTGNDSSFRAHHLLIVGVVSFFVGGVAIAAMSLYCCRYCRIPFWTSAAEKPSNSKTMQQRDVVQNTYFSPLQLKWNTSKLNDDEEPLKRNYYLPPFAADCGCGAATRRSQPKKEKEGDVHLTKYGVTTQVLEKPGANRSCPESAIRCARTTAPQPHESNTLTTSRTRTLETTDQRLDQQSNTKGTATLQPEPNKSQSWNSRPGSASAFSLGSGKISPGGFDNTYLAWPDGGRCFNYTASLQRSTRGINRGQRDRSECPNPPRYATVERSGCTKMGSFSKEFDLRWPANSRPLHQSGQPRPSVKKFRHDDAPVAAANVGTLPPRSTPADLPKPHIHPSKHGRTSYQDEQSGSAQSLPSWRHYNKMTVGQATLKRNALVNTSSIPNAEPHC